MELKKVFSIELLLFAFAFLLLFLFQNCGDIRGASTGLSSNPTVNLVCPSNYVLVPGMEKFGTQSFCVMKYEARAWNRNDNSYYQCRDAQCASLNPKSYELYHPQNYPNRPYQAVSIPEHLPWTFSSQAVAKQACENLGPGYRLISNREWMTIAHHIESQESNWGIENNIRILSRGHSNSSPEMPCDSLYENIEGTNCNDTGNNFKFKRTHNLPNSEVIWDFAGNLGEWIDWKVAAVDKAYVPDTQVGAGVGSREFPRLLLDGTIPSNIMSPIEWLPLNPELTSRNQIGQYRSGLISQDGVAFRGGWYADRSDFSFAGIYSLDLRFSENNGGGGNGFRCVYRK